MLDDQDLIAGARRLDEHALAETYDRYSPGLYRYAVRLLGDSEMAEDCVAETFSRLLGALHRGGGPRKHMQAYLYRVAHNWITDFYRQKDHTPSTLDPERQVAEGSDPHQAVEEKLQSESVRQALFQLTKDQRQVIVLKYLEGLTNKEVAEALDKPVGAVKSLQHRALASLQRLLVHEEQI